MQSLSTTFSAFSLYPIGICREYFFIAELDYWEQLHRMTHLIIVIEAASTFMPSKWPSQQQG
jgi:hypothetical protein